MMDRKRVSLGWLALGMTAVLGISPLGVQAEDGAASAAAPALDKGDTAWMLTSSALVLMMTIPGLALFYGGLVRQKNVLSTLMHSFFCTALISIIWVLWGYTLSFGPVTSGIVGGLDYLGMRGLVGALRGSVPALIFVMFQGTFAIITPALISGTFAERIRFPAFILLMLLWSTVIYCPLCHWVWGGGWIGAMGALDFAGGTVVHISSGTSALVTALFLGRRIGHGHEAMPPHNLPFAVVGASLLWVGWFGFNSGSALAADSLASIAFINTNTAAAAAALGWLLAEWAKTGTPTILGVASGAVAGLVTITPAAGFVTPMGAIIVGAIGGVMCYSAVSLKPRFGYDDALDVVGVHMVGGTTGALLTGVFATKAVNALGADGILYGGGLTLLGKQFVAVLATYAFCGLGTLVLLFLVNAITRLRAEQQEEILGLDLSLHSERAYHLGGGDSLAFVVEPRPASAPPVVGERFTIRLEGIEPARIIERWRSLCQDSGGPPSPAFISVYSQVTTLRDNRFRFRGGNRELLRRNLEQLFKEVEPSASAKVEEPR